MQPMVVLLPLPLGPRNPNMVPARTVSERFSTATVGPYFLTRLVRRIASIRSVSSFYDGEELFAAGVEDRTGEFQRDRVKRDGKHRERQEGPPVRGRYGCRGEFLE